MERRRFKAGEIVECRTPQRKTKMRPDGGLMTNDQFTNDYLVGTANAIGWRVGSNFLETPTPFYPKRPIPLKLLSNLNMRHSEIVCFHVINEFFRQNNTIVGHIYRKPFRPSIDAIRHFRRAHVSGISFRIHATSGIIPRLQKPISRS